MKAYSQDLRMKVLDAFDRGVETAEIAKAFGVSTAWARRVRQRRREHGEVAPRAPVGAHPFKIDREVLRQLVNDKPDATLAELRTHLGVECALSAVWNALRDLNLSYKKRLSTPQSNTDQTSCNAAPSGSCGERASIRRSSSSLTKRGRKRT